MRCDLQLDLLPWICTRLQTLNESKSFVSFEVLMDASHGLLEHYKKRLARKEVAKRKESEEKLSETNLFIRRLEPGTTHKSLRNLCRRSVNIFINRHLSSSHSSLVIPVIPRYSSLPSHSYSSQSFLVIPVITIMPVILSHASHASHPGHS